MLSPTHFRNLPLGSLLLLRQPCAFSNLFPKCAERCLIPLQINSISCSPAHCMPPRGPHIPHMRFITSLHSCIITMHFAPEWRDRLRHNPIIYDHSPPPTLQTPTISLLYDGSWQGQKTTTQLTSSDLVSYLTGYTVSTSCFVAFQESHLSLNRVRHLFPNSCEDVFCYNPSRAICFPPPYVICQTVLLTASSVFKWRLFGIWLS